MIPNSQFVVSRTAHKDNSSHYYIDEKKAGAREVVKLLLSHGVDLDHNRFLILQVPTAVCLFYCRNLGPDRIK